MEQKTANYLVIAGAISAALLAIKQNTNVFDGVSTVERERCYGVARAGANDCGTGKHSCAKRAMYDRQPDEWKMVPEGTCVNIGGSLTPSDKAQS
jgi:uncharacterized membrane protein